MKHAFGKRVVIALGGSIVYGETIDTVFIRRIEKFIRKFLRKKLKFVIVAGGGRLAREFQEAAGAISRMTDEDKDWIGIYSTRLNAQFLRTVFRDVASPIVFDSRKRIKRITHPVTIASGWRPGWSTDYVAAAIAADFNIPEFVVAGKPAYVYDADPNDHRHAKPIKKISWPHYRKLIPSQWKPGSHAPVDPVAARLAHRKEMKAVIINGKDLRNFENLLNGKEFKGTIIG